MIIVLYNVHGYRLLYSRRRDQIRLPTVSVRVVIRDGCCSSVLARKIEKVSDVSCKEVYSGGG